MTLSSAHLEKSQCTMNVAILSSDQYSQQENLKNSTIYHACMVCTSTLHEWEWTKHIKNC